MTRRRVYVIGAGQSRFGDRPEGPKALFREAFEAALGSVDHPEDFVRTQIEEAWIGSLGFGGQQLGNPAALLMEHVGLRGISARRVENACASSGFAFRDAYRAVASGAIDVALAGGVEKMNDLSPDHRRYWLGVSGDTEWERLAGLTFPGVYALMADRHMHEYGTTKEHLAAVAVKNHANGALNDKAQFQKAIDLERALAAPTVCDPLGLFDCCSTTDGASAVILASEEVAKRATDRPVRVLGSGAATDHLAIHDRPSLTAIPATGKAFAEACRESERDGRTITTDDIDIAEVHDCFTIAEILAVEDLGFCAKGKGGPYTASGATARDSGDGPAVNPSGGLKAKGHPLGATGTGQIVEVFQQLRGTAGERQVRDAEVALAHNVGGSGATCTVHLFAREVA
ncbi:MAG: thiolase domain-containing protein [Euryarchaeota archaeon]|nr:thiolase domain-containing protein [Euryarchaeota archaeon]